MNVPRTPFLELPGAVAASGPDLGTIAHYGAFVTEQRPFARGQAVADQGHLGVLRLTGADRLDWLDSLTSQRVRELAPGGSAETLLLDVQGRIEHMIAVLEDGQSTWLVTELAYAEAMRAWLDGMRFMRDVRVEDLSASYGVAATLAMPAAEESAIGAAAPAGVPLVWRDPWQHAQEGGTSYWPGAPEAHPGRGWAFSLHLLERDGLAHLADRVRSGQLRVAGHDAVEALRIAAWRPRIAREVDARALPHELDLLRSSVHLQKGCYRGQETIAKVHNLGHPPRRLALLDLDGSLGALPEPGSALYLAEDGSRRMIGRITSAAHHHEDGPIALALLKRSIDPSALLATDVDGQQMSCAQTVIVSPGAGRAANVPRLPRLPGSAGPGRRGGV